MSNESRAIGPVNQNTHD